MYAQLGNIQFEPLFGFESFADDEEAVWAERSPMSGKPIFTPTGNGARQANITIGLHQEFVNVASAHVALRNMMRNHETGVLLWGDGKVEGTFFIQKMARTLDEQDAQGRIYDITLTITLVEFTTNDSLSSEKQLARKNAYAVGDVTPVLKPKTNPQGKMQLAVNKLMKIRRIMRQIDRITAIPDNSSINGVLLTLTGALKVSANELKGISGEKGAGTNNSRAFDVGVDNVVGEVDTMQSFIPVVGGNLGQFNNSKKNLLGKTDSLFAIGGEFVKQVTARRP